MWLTACHKGCFVSIYLAWSREHYYAISGTYNLKESSFSSLLMREEELYPASGHYFILKEYPAWWLDHHFRHYDQIG